MFTQKHLFEMCHTSNDTGFGCYSNFYNLIRESLKKWGEFGLLAEVWGGGGVGRGFERPNLFYGLFYR